MLLEPELFVSFGQEAHNGFATAPTLRSDPPRGCSGEFPDPLRFAFRAGINTDESNDGTVYIHVADIKLLTLCFVPTLKPHANFGLCGVASQGAGWSGLTRCEDEAELGCEGGRVLAAGSNDA